MLEGFGVVTDAHFRGLRAIFIIDPMRENFDPDNPGQVKREICGRIRKLDLAYGNGPRITALVRKYAPQFGGVTFQTAWDTIAGEVEEGSESS